MRDKLVFVLLFMLLTILFIVVVSFLGIVTFQFQAIVDFGFVLKAPIKIPPVRSDGLKSNVEILLQ